MPSVVIAGASRGLGFALLNVWSKDESNTVIGLVRDTEATATKVAKELDGRKNIHLVKADLNEFASLKVAAEEASMILNGKLDILIANAAVNTVIYGDIGPAILKDTEKFDSEMLSNFRTNVMGSTHLLALFTPLILAGDLKKIAVISTGAGDPAWVADNDIAGQAPYAVSKAALNMVVAKFQAQLRQDGVVVTAISPGIVDTSSGPQPTDPDFGVLMGKLGAVASKSPNFKGLYQPIESATLVTEMIKSLKLESHGGKMISERGTQEWL